MTTEADRDPVARMYDVARDGDDRPMVRVHVTGMLQPGPVSVGTHVLVIRGA
jgi:hypothetical protein